MVCVQKKTNKVWVLFNFTHGTKRIRQVNRTQMPVNVGYRGVKIEQDPNFVVILYTNHSSLVVFKHTKHNWFYLNDFET